MNGTKRRILSFILSLVMMLSLAPSGVVWANGTPDMTDEEAVNKVYTEFSASTTYGNASKTPLYFPYEYEGKSYTNVVDYIKAWAKKETGKDIEVEFEANNGTPVTYTDWSTGTPVSKTIYKTAVSADGEVAAPEYNRNNMDKTVIGIKNVVFKSGEASSSTIKNILVKIKSLERTPDEILDYAITTFPFARFANGNKSKDYVVKDLRVDASNGMPEDSGLDTNLFLAVTWNVENISGNKDALAYKKVSNRNICQVKRPNVGEGDAKFSLSATVALKSDSSKKKTSDPIEVTVPAFDGVEVPIQVPKGAVFTVKDPYYSANVDSKYIKKESSTDKYDNYLYTLHTAADGSNLKYTYTLTKTNCLNASGNFTVTASGQEKVVIDEPIESSPNDTKLESLSLTKPAGTTDLIQGLIDFDPDVFEYNVEVKGVQQVNFAATTKVSSATVKITSRYSSVANANKGTLTTTAANATTACYLPDDADTTADIVFTVTAPTESVQTEKTRTYTVHVKKSGASSPMTGLAATVVTKSVKGTKNTSIGMEGVPEEEVVSFVSGGNDPGTYTVNYYRDKITVKPTAAGCTITVKGKTVVSGKDSEEISLEVGDNDIPIIVTKNGVDTEYHLNVRRKAELYITSYGVEGETLADIEGNGKNWSITTGTTMPYGTDVASVIVNANDKDADIKISASGGMYTGKAGKPIAVPTNGAEKLMMTIYVSHTVNGVLEAQKFVYSIARAQTYFANGVESYLPAPGQFVNGGNSWGNPIPTLSGNSGITLGAFGGNVVYRFDEPIQNDPANPYGVDFIVIGNVFNNSDGSSSAGASEPASVMVSEDGNTWYELAGSKFFDDSSVHNYTVTYTNPDTSFSGSADVPWKDNLGGTGAVAANSYHTQAYYPNPTDYNKYQTGVGANSTYTIDSVSFTGTKINYEGQPIFGYGDNHYSPNGKDNNASNPYAKNHLMGCNGDGFDLAWAVDDNGNPVTLKSVKYVKVYNPILLDGGARGDISPEIMGILRAQKGSSSVGESAGLTALTIGGKSVELTPDKNAYEVSIGKETKTSIIPTAAGANIYVNNDRVESGEELKGIKVMPGAKKTVRIVVQDGEKQPKLYYITLTTDSMSQSEIDTAMAADVDEQILEIGEVTLSSRLDVKNARAAYDALTDAQKNLVKNYEVLTKAENALAELLKNGFGHVRVIVDNTTFNETSAAAAGEAWKSSYWTGTLIDTTVELTANDDMMTCLIKAVEAEHKSQKGAESGYVSAIEGLAAGDGGVESGWMVTLNDWFCNAGADSFKVSNDKLFDGDVIRFTYSLNMGVDVGSLYDNSDTSLVSLVPSAGALSPAFNKDAKDYTLELPRNYSKVSFAATAYNKNFNVILKKGNKEYRRTAAVPVNDGDVVNVICGQGASMSKGEPTTYNVKIKLVAAEEVAPQPTPTPEPTPEVTPEPVVEVKPEPVGDSTVHAKNIKLNKSSAKLEIGEGFTLIATVKPENAGYEWSCSDTSVASITQNGKGVDVKALRAGKANVTATSMDGKRKATCKITVNGPVEAKSVSIKKKASKIEIGQTMQLTAKISPDKTADKTLTWESLTPGIASVEGDGLTATVTGLGAGKAKIRATTVNGKHKEVTVTVKGPVEASSVSIKKQASKVEVGKTLQLKAVVNPDKTVDKTVTWECLTPELASIESDGGYATVTGLKAGKAKVRVTTVNGKHKDLTITVKGLVEARSVTIKKKSSKMEIGKSMLLTAKISPAKTVDKTVTWENLNPEIAKLDINGSKATLTGLSAGKAAVKVTTANGKTKTVYVTIKEAKKKK